MARTGLFLPLSPQGCLTADAGLAAETRQFPLCHRAFALIRPIRDRGKLTNISCGSRSPEGSAAVLGQQQQNLSYVSPFVEMAI
jgi:hypothetical protein